MPDYRLATRRAAIDAGIDPDIFSRQINAESGFNPKAGSPAGAQGIAQFMPATARGMGVDLNDGRARDDLAGAAKLMANYVKKYGNYRDALVAYNAGPGRVGKPLYAETANYVAKILNGKNPPASVGRSSAPTTPRLQPGNNTATATDNSAARGAAIAQFLGRRNQDPVEFAMNIRSLRDVPSSAGTTDGAASDRRPTSSQSAGGGAAVAFGQSRLGQYAEDAGSNRGGQLDSLQSKFGMRGQPWCAMFTSVAVTRGGAPKVARTASVGEVRAQVTRGGAGYEKGFKGAARPGDLWLRGNAHIGLVERVDSDGTIHTIEGNTGGGKVERRTHRPGEGDIARPLYSRQLR